MSDAPKRIQRKRTKGWKMPPNTVSVTRPGRFGNPFRVGQRCWVFSLGAFVMVRDNRHAVALFRLECRHLKELAKAELRGKDVACFCEEDERWCHGDVLIKWANREG